MIYYFCGLPGCLPLVSPRLTHVAAFSWRLGRKVQAGLSHMCGALVLALGWGTSVLLHMALTLQQASPAPSQPGGFWAAF